MNRLIFLLFITLLTIITCGKEKITPSSSTELFTGELVLNRIEEVFERTDTVNFTIIGRSYTLNHFTNESNLCSSYGTQSGFGTNKLILFPDTLPGTNCDNNRIPKGEFNAVFKGDSLILGPRIDTLFIEVGENDIRREIWNYHLKLTKQ